MKVLKFSEMELRWIGLGYRSADSPDLFLRSPQSYFFVLGLVGPLFALNALHVYTHANDLNIVIEQFQVMSGSIALLGSYVSFGINTNSMKQLHTQLQEIVERVKYRDAYKCYSQAETSTRAFTKWILIYFAVCSIFGAFLPPVCYSMYCILLLGNFDTSTWLVTNIPIPVPFDTSTVFGWYMQYLVHLWAGTVFNITIPTLIPYFVNCCSYIDACCGQFKMDYEKFDESFSKFLGKNLNRKTLSTKKEEKPSLNDIKSQLNDLVRFHIKTIDVFDLVAELNSGTIFFSSLLNVLYFACMLYTLEKSMSNFGIMVIFNALASSYSLIETFLLCYSGTRGAHTMSCIGNIAFNSEWYTHPVNMQRVTISIIQRSQQSKYFTGFRVISCTLETFTLLIKTSISYYLMFQKLSSH